MNNTFKSMESVAVNNAGIVILNSYIPMLFERLGLTADKQFTTKENQVAAVQYLQYLVTGMTDTEDRYVPLLKVLCGISQNENSNGSIAIAEGQIKLIEGLFIAVIGHWTAIGACTLDGFRGNWLVRDGLLRELDDRWELTVEKRAYDILINRAPFSFSVIKYPWMQKPLYVTWPS